MLPEGDLESRKRLNLFAGALPESQALPGFIFFFGEVAKFKQMFLYLQPLLWQSSFYGLRKKVAWMGIDSYLCSPKIS